MAKQYLECLDALLAPVARDLPPEAALEIKHFFSGAAASKAAPLMGFGFELSDTVRGERFTTRAQRRKVGSLFEIRCAGITTRAVTRLPRDCVA